MPLETDSLCEHYISYTTFHSGECAAGMVLVEEVVERQHECDEASVAVCAAVGESEVESKTVKEHTFRGSGVVACSSDSHVVVHAGLDSAFLSHDDSGTRLEIESAQVVAIAEAELLAFEISSGIDSCETGFP